MKTILFSSFLFFSLVSGFIVTDQVRAERDVVVTPAPPRTQTARPVEVRSVTTQPAPVPAKPAVSPVAAPVVKKTLQPSAPIASAPPEKKAAPVAEVKKETSPSQASKGFFQGLLDRWFPKR